MGRPQIFDTELDAVWFPKAGSRQQGVGSRKTQSPAFSVQKGDALVEIGGLPPFPRERRARKGWGTRRSSGVQDGGQRIETRLGFRMMG